jgi:hypothetical protein
MIEVLAETAREIPVGTSAVSAVGGAGLVLVVRELIPYLIKRRNGNSGAVDRMTMTLQHDKQLEGLTKLYELQKQSLEVLNRISKTLKATQEGCIRHAEATKKLAERLQT